MWRVAAAFTLLAAGCGGGKKTPGNDDAIPGEGGTGDGPSACDPLPALPACANPVSGTTISARMIGNVGSAVLATSPPNDPRLFVVTKAGYIRIFENEQLKTTPFLDVSALVSTGAEQGLLGLAFHPSYHCNGQFFVYYTADATDTMEAADIVARCTVSASDPNVANPTCTTVLSIADPRSNHNGGMIEFGSDGYLYIGTGDGGGQGDPDRNAQALNDGSPQADTLALLGKILRIDVDHPSNGKEYGIPADNPFANGGGRPEIFVIGLRNPWRWSFDRGTGDMWIGDVGQNGTEELNVLKAGEQAAANLGWSVFEANACCDGQATDNCAQTSPDQGCDATGKVFPLDARTQDPGGWLSIIAGQVYRGTCYPDLVGWHFYRDHTEPSGTPANNFRLHKARLMGNGQLEIVDLEVNVPTGTFNNIASIHADARGELYMTSTNGSVFHLEAGP
jgi:glucose/arabinose dehydrogenase